MVESNTVPVLVLGYCLVWNHSFCFYCQRTGSGSIVALLRPMKTTSPPFFFLCYTREVIDMMKQQLEKLKKDYKDQKRPVVETAMGS